MQSLSKFQFGNWKSSQNENGKIQVCLFWGWGGRGMGFPPPPPPPAIARTKNKTPSGQSNLESKLEASHFLVSNYTIKLK